MFREAQKRDNQERKKKDKEESSEKGKDAEKKQTRKAKGGDSETLRHTYEGHGSHQVWLVIEKHHTR